MPRMMPRARRGSGTRGGFGARESRPARDDAAAPPRGTPASAPRRFALSGAAPPRALRGAVQAARVAESTVCPGRRRPAPCAGPCRRRAWPSRLFVRGGAAPRPARGRAGGARGRVDCLSGAAPPRALRGAVQAARVAEATVCPGRRRPAPCAGPCRRRAWPSRLFVRGGAAPRPARGRAGGARGRVDCLSGAAPPRALRGAVQAARVAESTVCPGRRRPAPCAGPCRRRAWPRRLFVRGGAAPRPARGRAGGARGRGDCLSGAAPPRALRGAVQAARVAESTVCPGRRRPAPCAGPCRRRAWPSRLFVRGGAAPRPARGRAGGARGRGDCLSGAAPPRALRGAAFERK